MAAYYHGSRNAELSFYPGICFTVSQASAAEYGDYVHVVSIDVSALRVKRIEMTAEEMRNAIDNQSWPCDKKKEIVATIAEGYDAVSYLDCDASGRVHDCIRILTASAFAAAVCQ